MQCRGKSGVLARTRTEYLPELESGSGFSGRVGFGSGSKLISSNFVRNFINSMF